jgi:pimeloyl-ACP methyl ester carboxylesterase
MKSLPADTPVSSWLSWFKESGMSWATRGVGFTRELGMVLPRTVAGLNESTGWAPASPRGVRQFGEVMLDELVLSGFSLLGGNLTKEVRPLDACAPAAEELSALGIDGAHTEPKPLRVTSIRRRRLPGFGAGLAYERIMFEHDPALPPTLAAEGLGGPARAVVHVCRHRDGPRPWLIWVHGAGQGGSEDLLLSRIGRIHHRLGFNVAMPVQPGHGCRRREWPAYPDMDPLGNVAGMMRAVSEVRAVVRWAQPQSTAIAVSGISLGTPVAALVSHLEKQVDAVALYTPILGLNAMIARHLDRWGSAHDGFRKLLQSPVVAQLTSVIDPLKVDPSPPPQRRLIVGAWHDRMAMREPAIALHERWGGQLYWYDGSHVGHVFSRRVQRVSERFLRGVVEEAVRG